MANIKKKPLHIEVIVSSCANNVTKYIVKYSNWVVSNRPYFDEIVA